jgi:hypothetical protein
MAEADRRLEQRIIDYLDGKAKSSKVSELMTAKSYASVEEISRKLHAPVVRIMNLVKELQTQNKIKEYRVKGLKKYYGSVILPSISKDCAEFRGKSERSYMIYAREILINRNMLVS